jgi:hypothetical protein
MRSMQACAAISAAMWMACGVQHTDGNGGQPSGSSPNGAPGSEPGGVSASCPLGVASFTAELGLSNPSQVLELAVDASGNAFVGASVQAFSPSLAGVFAVSAFARVVSVLPAGSQVAVDAAGNVLVAGSFTAPLDLGLGVMVPQGNIDVFVAKLDAKGRLIFAKQLGLCGDGLSSLAVSRDGRIAVSGAAMGTAILSASGDVALVLADAGFVAFDSKGNLVIAETLAAGVVIAPLATSFDVRGDEVVILKVDAAGRTIFRQSFSGDAMFTGVAVDMNDNVALVGFASGAITFFGTTITPRSGLESGRVTGAFLIELDAACSLVMVRDLGIVEANAVAFDARGDIFIAGASTGNTGFFRIETVLGIDARGGDIVIGSMAERDGRATSIAADVCGAVLFSSVRQDTPSAASAIRAIVEKITL